MDIYYLGHSCFKIKTREVTIITDPFNPESLGIKFPPVEADIVTISHEHSDHNYLEKIIGNPIVIRGPGEYEIKGVKIYGINTYHDDQNGAKFGSNTVYNIKAEGISLLHLGDLGHKLKPETIERLNSPDILFIPTGGYYTINANIASEIVSLLEPKIVLPMHFKTTKTSADFSNNLETVAEFLKTMRKENITPQNKLHITKESLPQELTIFLFQ